MDTTYLPLNVTVPTDQVMILTGAGTYARYYPTSQRVDSTSTSVTNAQVGPFTEETVWRLTPSAGGIGYDINIPLDSLATELSAAEVNAVQALVSGGGILDYDEPILFTGDSICIGAITGTWNPVFAAMQAATGRWVTAGNTGVGGETSTQIAARLAANMTTYGARNVVVVSCFWNDIGQGVSLATSQAAWASMIATVKAGSGRIIFCSPTPDALTGSSLARRQAADDRWWALRALCSANAVPFIDIRTPLANQSTGQMAAAYNADNSVHPNDAGNAVIGGEIAAVLNTLYPGKLLLGALDAVDQKDLLAGVGLFGSSSGGVGTGWSYASATGATPTVTSGVQQIACGGTYAGGAYMDTANFTGWAVGDLLEMRGQLALDAAGTSQPRVRLLIGGTGNPYPLLEQYIVSTAKPFCMRHRVLAGTTTIAARLQAIGTGTANIQLSKFVIRNLTALGLA